MATLFRGVNTRAKLWLRFTLANLKKKMLQGTIFAVKIQQKITPDVFTPSTDLRKVSLIHLEVNLSEEWQKQQT